MKVKLYFPDGIHSTSRMQFPPWILQVSTTCGDDKFTHLEGVLIQVVLGV